MNEKTILQDLAKSDKNSMQAIYDEYYLLLCKIAHLKLKDQNLVRDVVQDLMLDIWKRRETLDIKGSLKSYLIKSLVYKISRTNQYLRPTSELKNIHTESNSVSDEIEYNQLREQINSIVDTMPLRVKQCFLLSRKDGLKHKEIAKKLEISPKTVDHHISKALKILRESLKKWI